MVFSERRFPAFPIRIAAIAATALCLTGCSSRPPTPPLFEIELESTPPGAEARTSFGQACKTPCSVSTPLPDNNFTVSYTLENYQPVTVPVQVTGSPAGFMTPGSSRIEPNPVVATLQPVEPPKPEKPVRPKKPKQPKATATAPPPGTSTR
jgi:hypothetical protein